MLPSQNSEDPEVMLFAVRVAILAASQAGSAKLVKPSCAPLALRFLNSAKVSMICTGWPVSWSRSQRLKMRDRSVSTERAGATWAELPKGVSAMSLSVITATYLPPLARICVLISVASSIAACFIPACASVCAWNSAPLAWSAVICPAVACAWICAALVAKMPNCVNTSLLPA